MTFALGSPHARVQSRLQLFGALMDQCHTVHSLGTGADGGEPIWSEGQARSRAELGSESHLGNAPVTFVSSQSLHVLKNGSSKSSQLHLLFGNSFASSVMSLQLCRDVILLKGFRMLLYKL